MAMGQNGIYTQSYMTKMRIARATETICEHTSFASISTGEIAQAANVSRSSFYYHFESKNDLVRWLSNHFYSEGIDQIGRSLSWFEGHLVTTTYFDKFPNLFEGAAHDTSYDAARPNFVRHRIDVLTETVTEWKRVELTNLLRFQIETLANAEMRMNRNVGAWYKDLPVKEFSALMASIAPKELFELLDKPVHPRPSGGLQLML